MATLDLGVRHREARRLPMSQPRPNADQVRSCSARQRGLVSAGDGNSAVRGVCLGARRVVPAARLSVGSRFSKRTLDDRRDASRAELPILRRPRGSRRVFQIRRFCESGVVQRRPVKYCTVSPIQRGHQVNRRRQVSPSIAARWSASGRPAGGRLLVREAELHHALLGSGPRLLAQ